MFSTPVVVFLILCATIQLIAIVSDPTPRLKGKSSLQMKAALKSETLGSGSAVMNQKGQITAVFWTLILVPLSLLISLVVEPITFIVAINREIGNKYLAIGAIFIIAVWIVRTVVTYRLTKQAGKDATSEQEKQELELKMGWKLQGNNLVATVRKIFFVLPDLYLVYLIILALNN